MFSERGFNSASHRDTAFKQVPEIAQGLFIQLVGPLLRGSAGILDRWVFTGSEDFAILAKLDRVHPDRSCSFDVDLHGHVPDLLGALFLCRCRIGWRIG
jgi:hypothetical protein